MPPNGLPPTHALEADLERRGYARLPSLLDRADCETMAALYPKRSRFRSFIDMERHRFGSGAYRYFDRPLPHPVRLLRSRLYERLAPIANRWEERLGNPTRYPKHHRAFEEMCRDGGQTRPTPLLLRYEAGGYNCLHQDLYGEIAFPLQVVCLLSDPSRDFSGGSLLLVEQRPRAQSRGEALHLEQGEGIVFPGRDRPILGKRGDYRARVRHGVSTIESGVRMTLGIIFHDAE